MILWINAERNGLKRLVGFFTYTKPIDSLHGVKGIHTPTPLGSPLEILLGRVETVKIKEMCQKTN